MHRYQPAYSQSGVERCCYRIQDVDHPSFQMYCSKSALDPEHSTVIAHTFFMYEGFCGYNFKLPDFKDDLRIAGKTMVEADRRLHNLLTRRYGKNNYDVQIVKE